MMKQFILTLVIAVVATAIAACGGAAVNTNTTKPASNDNANKTAAPANTNADKTSAPAGDTLKIDEAGIQMTVPKGFKFSKDGEDTVVKTEDEGVDIRFNVPKDGDYDKARLDAAKEIDEYIDNVKIDEKDVKKTINGMEAYSSSGTGKDSDEKDVLWELTVLKTDKKPVLVIIYAEKPSMEKHAAALKGFLESVKKQ